MLFYKIPSVCTVQMPSRQFKLQTTGVAELGCNTTFGLPIDCASVADPLGATCDQIGGDPDVSVRYFASQTPCSQIGGGNNCSVDVDGTILNDTNCETILVTGTDCGNGCYVEVFCHSLNSNITGSCATLSGAVVNCPVPGSCNTGVTNIT